jgi:hypothetical protein
LGGIKLIAGPFSAQLYLLEDHPRTLFPLTTSKIVVAQALPEIKSYVAEIVDQRTSEAFLPQQRCYSSKTGYHLRRTMALDPVAAYFMYDLIYEHRAKLVVKRPANRRTFGYKFQLGRPVVPSLSYGKFREAVREAAVKYKHAIAFDVSAYFNSVYHHDLVEWFEASIASGPHRQFGQYLRECNKGRSLDCLPHGFHPCKAIGSAFLNDVDTSVQLQSTLLLRFLDDFYLFDNDEGILNSDFVKIQHLLGERGLTLNTNKTKRDDEVLRLAPGTIDEIKVELLQRRREIIIDVSGESQIEEVDEEEDDEPLSDEQLEYLMALLRDPDIDESDAELVLTVLQSRDEDVLEHLTDFLVRFPSLSRRIYSYSKHVEDKTELAILLDGFVKNTKTATEDQLFWIAKIAEDYLQGTLDFSRLMLRLYQHPEATPIVQAKVLEISGLKAGFQDIREKHLQGSSDWRTWTSVVGSASLPKGPRNQMLKYIAKASRMNSIVAAAIMKT